MTNTSQKVQDVYHDGKETVKATVKGNDQVKEKWADTVEDAKEVLDSAKVSAREVTEAASNKVKELNQCIAESISKNPWKAVAITALCSWILIKLTNK